MSDAQDATLQSALEQAVEQGASDLHVVVGYPATLRIHGQLVVEQESTSAKRTAAQ